MHRLRFFLQKNAWWVTLLPVILISAIMFYFSSQPSDASVESSGIIVDLVIKIFVPDFNELSSEEQDSLKSSITYFVRKAAHFSEFAALGFFIMLHLEALRKTRGLKLNLLPRMTVSWLAGTAIAASDETHQLFVPGRSGEVRDVMIDSSGVLFGAVFLLCFLYFLKKHLKNHV